MTETMSVIDKFSSKVFRVFVITILQNQKKCLREVLWFGCYQPCQIHGCSTRTANNYRVNHCRTNLKKFKILYRGPKISNSLPVQITSLSSFPNFKKKLLEFLVKWLLKWQSHTLQQYRCNSIVMYKVASTISQVVSRGHLTIH